MTDRPRVTISIDFDDATDFECLRLFLLAAIVAQSRGMDVTVRVDEQLDGREPA